MSVPHFRDYHVMLDEQADQLYAMTDPIAERIRKLGGTTLRSISHIARTQRILDNDANYVELSDMQSELCEDNKTWPPGCVKCTTSATSTVILPVPASSKSGSTRPSGAPGSCLKPAGQETPPGIEIEAV